MSTLQRRSTLVGLALAAALVGSSAHAVNITREFAANWFDPAHSGHGFAIDVIDSSNGKTLLVNWFTYDLQGRPLWIGGTGPVVGDHAKVIVGSGSGGSFDNRFDPKAVKISAWGTLDIAFSDCNNGSVTFTPDDRSLPSGRMPITRLTTQFRTSCSGGISDDRSTSASDTSIVQFMTNTGLVAQASGRASFRQRTSRTDFDVEVQGLPIGAYELRANGVAHGTIQVVASASGTRGELELRSPAESGHPLLDFDPRGQTITVAQSSSVFLTTPFGSTVTPPVGGSGAPPFGDARYTLRVQPSGNRGTELQARLEQRKDRVEFKAELNGLAVGPYTLRVGGVERGTITVRKTVGGTTGEIEFRVPQGDDPNLLDFDPRGQLVDVLSNGSIVMSGTFPTLPDTKSSGSGSDDNGGSGTGGGSDDPPGDDHGGTGSGSDDPPGDDHGGSGGHGGDDNGGDDHGGSGGGSDDPPGHG